MDNNNTASGHSALFNNTTGIENTAVGIDSLRNNTTGSNNIALGFDAGVNLTTGSNNIYIAALGAAAESDTVRIGRNTHTRTIIKGIRGETTGVANAVSVLIDGTGELGTINSSRRFKEAIQDMGESSSGLMQLRPVTFRYTEAYANGERPVQPGLIAEEVAEVYPDLVVHDNAGEVETVQYHKLIPMLLNELQKQEKRISELETRLLMQETDQAMQIADSRLQIAD